MNINFPLKRKRFTIIELFITIFLLSIIITQGLYLLSSQTKQAVYTKKSLQKFLKQEEVVIALEGLFFHLNTQDRGCLRVDEKICVHFDNGIQKKPSQSGFQKGILKLEKNQLILEFEEQKNSMVLADSVISFSVSFYSQKTNWQQKWQSTSQGLPEMIHVKLKTKNYEIDQKFLCPYQQIPVILSCKFSPLFFL